MNTNTTSLDRLHDIVVPAPVSWWPPAPAWYWVIGFVLILVLVLACRAFIHWQRNRYRREALAELVQLEHQWKAVGPRSTVLLALAELLKRTALTAFPREQVATLTGPEWFAFLDRTARGSCFGVGLGSTLENAIYDPHNVAALEEEKVQSLLSASRHWIRNHKTQTQQKEAKTPPDDEPSLPLFPSVQKP